MLALLFAAAVVADSPVVRRGLTDILGASAELRVVGSAPLDEAQRFDAESVDVIVEDVPDDTTAEIALSRVPAGVPVLALVGRPERTRELVQSGAQGALRRDASGESLMAASVAVAAGLYPVDPGTVAPPPTPRAPTPHAGAPRARGRGGLQLRAGGA